MAGGENVMRFIGWLLGALLLIAAGWIGGPVAMASYRVATATDPAAARQMVALTLVEAHASWAGDNTPPSRNAAIRACGYDPAVLLRDEKLPFLRSADWGSEVLRRRAAGDYEAIAREPRASHLAVHHSTITLAALTECLGTPLATFCRGKVDRMIAAVDGADAKKIAETQAFAREQDHAILCTFLDGAAARRGIAKTTPAPKPAP